MRGLSKVITLSEKDLIKVPRCSDRANMPLVRGYRRLDTERMFTFQQENHPIYS